MADDADALSPGVELERRRLHPEGRCGVGGEVERHLVRRARAGRGDGPGEAELDRPVQVAAQHALHLRMASDYARERVASFQADLVHVADQWGEGGVVHDEQWRLVAFQEKDLSHPGEPTLLIMPPPPFPTLIGHM